MSQNPLARAERILSREDWDSLEQKVEAQGEAIKLLYQALREMAREIDRQLKRVNRDDPFQRGARY